jgi:subtilisin-like proprotein convertase family protein
MILGIWDGGLVRVTHQELESRVVQLDNPNNFSNHATHVSGTMIASGVDLNAKGMAPEAELIAYDFNNDLSEMAIEAANGMLISNHSYGTSPGSIPDSVFGAYLPFTAQLDQLVFNAPYYLPVFAAGNSNDAFPAFNPTKNGYDLISGLNLAKNIICVANVLEINNYNGPSSVVVWDSSSWGPTDDGRIKPDISAKGRLTYSSTASGDDTYSSYTGTSMAAPNVSGSIALLQEHHKNIYGNFLTAASIRALVIHTAREAGNSPGPDYKFGWGLMDSAEAASLIKNKDFTSIIEENTLNLGDTYTFTVEATDSNTPLIATIAWTDAPGPVQGFDNEDDSTPRLVNDLDIKITAPDGFTQFLPWKLNPSQPDAPAIKADNIVDNVEKIQIDNAVGNYTIEVSHKGILQNLSQDYSLIVSGVAETDFAIVSNESFKSFCANDVGSFTIDINSQDSFNANINISLNGLPSALNASFTATTIANQGETVLNIDNLNAVPVGDYPFTVTATSGLQSLSYDFILNIRPAEQLDDIIINSPTDNTSNTGLYPTLNWEPVNIATSYEVEFSTSPSFNTIQFAFITEQTSLDILSELNANQMYYWRVKAISDCVTGNFFNASFETKAIECNPVVFSTDTPVFIDGDEPNIVQSVVTIPGNLSQTFSIEDVNISLDISHTYISDLAVSLTSPQGTTITLFDNVCGDLDDIDAIFDDKGLALSCNTLLPPAVSGTIRPELKLEAFIGEPISGDWILTVQDFFNGDGGSINSFGVEVCYEETLSNLDFEINNFNLYPNPSTGMVNLNFGQTLQSDFEVKVYDLNGKLLYINDISNGSNKFVIDLNHLNSGLYFVKLESGSHFSVKKLIIK